MINVILSGRNGTIFGSLSCELMPKQFLKLHDEILLFQKTIVRNQKICDSILVISHYGQFYLAFDQCLSYSGKSFRFVLDAEAKNTASVILLSRFCLNDEDIVFIAHCNHLISTLSNYYSSIGKAQEFAEQVFWVIFRIKPTEDKPGFGYIESVNTYHVRMFHKKYY